MVPGVYFAFRDPKPEPRVPDSPSNDASSQESPTPTDDNVFPFVIVGGGTAAYNAVLGIRDVQEDAEILILSNESLPPYRRAPLSKPGFSKLTSQTVEYSGLHEYQVKQVPGKPGTQGTLNLMLNTQVIDLDVSRKIVSLSSGHDVKFDNLLLATGSKPDESSQSSARDLYAGRLPETTSRQKIVFYKSFADHQRLIAQLREDTGRPKKVALVGAGLSASEMASALVCETQSIVHQITDDAYPLARLVPPSTGESISNGLQKMGVQVLPQTRITRVAESPDASSLLVHLDQHGQERTEEYDMIIHAGASAAQDQLGRQGKLEIDATNGGIVVSPELMARSNVYVAGDAASYYDVVLGVRRRAAYEQAAATQGYMAGHNMALKSGPKAVYTYEPAFHAEIGGIHIEGVGIVSSGSPTCTVCNDAVGDKQKCVVFYMERDRIIGVLSVNLGKQESQAKLCKRIVRAKLDKQEIPDLAKMFPIYDD